MRHVSHRAVARAAAGFAILVAVPAAAVRAQTNPTKPSAEAQLSVSGSLVCDKTPPAANSSSALFAKCGIADAVDPNTGQLYSGTSTTQVTPGLNGSLHLSTNFKGSSPGVGMSANGQYLEYVNIEALPGFNFSDISTIFLSSQVTFKAASDAPSFTATDNLAELDQGVLNPDGTPNMDSFQTDFRFYPLPTDDPFATQNLTLQTSINGFDLGGFHTFWFQMTSQTDNIIFQADPNASTDNLFLSPTITVFGANGQDLTPGFAFHYDPPVATTTPEPASVVLTLTGLASLAGFARRRRRSTTDATE